MNPKLSKEEIEKLRKDPKHFICKGLVYYCREDPYCILPKRIPWMGWTINMAHPNAVKMLIIIPVVTTAPLLWILFTVQSCWAFTAGFLVDLILLCFWMHYESNKPL